MYGWVVIAAGITINIMKLLEAGHVGEEKERESTEFHGGIVLLLDGIIAGSACSKEGVTASCILIPELIYTPIDRASDKFP